MGTSQPGSILNLLLLLIFAGGGWFIAAWTKAPARAQAVIASTAGTTGNQPGAFAADARAVMARGKAGRPEFDELTARYGSGSSELHLLAVPLFDKWAAGDPAEAAVAGLERCMAHTPDLLPHLLAVLATREKCDPSKLLAVVPDGPQRHQALAALAAALGSREPAEIPAGITALTSGDRSLFLREWHRGRAHRDAAAADQSAGSLTDADERESARTGCRLARAAANPEAALSEPAASDYPEIAETAFRAWLPRDVTGAWNYVASRRGDPRLPQLCAALFKAEMPRRRFSEALPEIQSLLTRHFPSGPPMEVLAVLIPPLAAERTLTAQKFVDWASGSGAADSLRSPASVLLFDALCLSDPAAAWRLAGAIVQTDGARDGRSAHGWSSALSRSDASPAQRLAAGFPDFTDMANLALHWLETDPAEAIVTYAAPGVQIGLQRLVIEAALHSGGSAIPLAQLLQWARSQAPHIPHTIEAVAADIK